MHISEVPMMNYLALVSLLILAQYIFFTMRAGLARGKDTVVAPAMTGDEKFERRLRVQLNTLEQLAIVIPAMWLCAHFFRADLAAGFGVLFLIGRFMYSAAYLSEPAKRGPGMIVTMFSNVALILCTLFGVARNLI